MIFVLILSVCALSATGRDFSDKNIALLGDSNTWIGGDDCSNSRGWNYWFANDVKPKNIKSYARSGATWTHTAQTQPNVEEYTEVISDNNVIFNQIVRLFADVDINGAPKPDIIIISAGTNDAWFADRRPEEFSKTADEALGRDSIDFMVALPSAFRSLPEAVRYDLTFLHSFFPEAQVVVLTPIPSIKISAEMLGKVSDLIESVAGRMDALVIRMDLLSPIDPTNEVSSHRFTTDGTHTSVEGAQRHAEIVSKSLLDN